MGALGGVRQQLKHLEVALGVLQTARLQLGERQGLAGDRVVRALAVGQGFQPLLQSRVGGGVQQGKGGFEAGHVADDLIGRGRSGLVEQPHRLFRAPLLDPDAGLLHQRHRLVAAEGGLGRIAEGAEGVVQVAFLGGVERRGVGLGSLGHLAVAIGVEAPDPQRDDERRQGDAQSPRPGLQEKLPVPVRAELLVDLFKKVGQSAGAPGGRIGGANLAARRPGRNAPRMA